MLFTHVVHHELLLWCPSLDSCSKEMRVFDAALAALAKGKSLEPDPQPFGGGGADTAGDNHRIRDWGIGPSADSEIVEGTGSP